MLILVKRIIFKLLQKGHICLIYVRFYTNLTYKRANFDPF